MKIEEKIAVICCLWNAFKLTGDQAMFQIWGANKEENMHVWRLWQKAKKPSSVVSLFNDVEKEILSALYRPLSRVPIEADE